MQPQHLLATGILIVFLAAIFLLITTLRKYAEKNNLPEDSLEYTIIDIIQKLFLFAEKQVQFNNNEKMDFVVEKIVLDHPEEIEAIAGNNVREFTQSVYDKYTEQFSEYKKDLDNQTVVDISNKID